LEFHIQIYYLKELKTIGLLKFQKIKHKIISNFVLNLEFFKEWEFQNIPKQFITQLEIIYQYPSFNVVDGILIKKFVQYKIKPYLLIPNYFFPKSKFIFV
jgi:hypothetical protein